MKIIIACILSFAVSAITGKFLVPELRKLKAGQSIREDGPTWHAGKAGTPTMGGLMFILGIFVSILICGWKGMMAGDFGHLYIFFFALIFGGIGFLDDFEKVKHKQNLGLTAIQKFLLQLAAAVAFLCLMRFEGMLTPNLYIPFVNTYIILNWVVYMIFAAFVIVGTVNAVNITDGIDGLAGSVTVPVGLFFTVLAIWWQGYEQLGIYAAALVGGLLGFLIYNFHPAKVFMGDTGSLALGSALACIAIITKTEVFSLIIGGLFVAEACSVILQVVHYKRTKKRLFLMAPLHHHFEKKGWSETKVVIRFWIVSGALAGFGFVLFFIQPIVMGMVA